MTSVLESLYHASVNAQEVTPWRSGKEHAKQCGVTQTYEINSRAKMGHAGHYKLAL